MKTLKELLAARAALDAQIASAHKGEAEEALATVRRLVEEFGFTAQQVFPWKHQPKHVAAKYLDEKTGATWSGRGKPPKWIAGKDRDAFLVQKPAAPAQGPFLAEMAAAAHRRRS